MRKDKQIKLFAYRIIPCRQSHYSQNKYISIFWAFNEPHAMCLFRDYWFKKCKLYKSAYIKNAYIIDRPKVVSGLWEIYRIDEQFMDYTSSETRNKSPHKLVDAVVKGIEIYFGEEI